jgi:HSP20 family protein
MNIWTIRPGWDPFAELQRQVDRLFDFTSNLGRQVSQSWKQFPSFNLYETGQEYALVAPMPGVRPEDLDVSVLGNTVVLKGERKRSGAVPDEFYRRQERWQGKWSRNVSMPDKADLSGLSATLDNGLLVLKIPKLPETPPRQVPVRVAAAN